MRKILNDYTVKTNVSEMTILCSIRHFIGDKEETPDIMSISTNKCVNFEMTQQCLYIEQIKVSILIK